MDKKDQEYKSNEELVKNALQQKNVPYERIEDDEGNLLNPITKTNPYYSMSVSRRELKRRLRMGKLKNNSKGNRIIITDIGGGRFMKTNIVRQTEGNKQIFHNVIKNK